MKQRTKIIYISGLGDRYDSFRRLALKHWGIYGVETELVSMSWADGKSYEEKKQRVIDAIHAVDSTSTRVVIIGESAGGSMALNVYADQADYIFKAMTLCGKNTGPEKVSPSYYRRNPAFKTSMSLVNDSINRLKKSDRQRFISLHPIVDGVVPVKDTLIPDCKTVTLFSFGHLTTIFLALTIGAWKVASVAKQ